ncbi:MAG: N-acetylmuramoyl-L-alanine amidase, partial [Firmicutes bacterium]|nr:N-acetylmuramoyl-L-alanine amidase [Bacillota bacterium]
MPIDKKKTIPLVFFTLFFLIMISAPVSAAISGFVARDSSGDYYEYAYEDLIDSYALEIIGSPNGLYDDFAAKETVALLSSSGAYLDYKDVLDNYAAAILLGKAFNIKKYAESEEAKIAQMPATVSIVKLVSGKVAFNVKNLSSSTESNPDFDPPKTKTAINGAPTVTLEQAQLWAAGRSANQRFIDIAPLYWEYGAKTGMRPEVLYAQAAMETGFGRYGNRVLPEYNNWAGIKVAYSNGDEPEDHEVFATPEDGVRAHFNHMAAYVGLPPVGDPHARYHVVARQTWAGSVLFVEDLSGKWAPQLDYHVYILTQLDQMFKTKTTAEENSSQNTPDPEPNPADGGTEGTIRSVAVNVDVLRLRSGPGTDNTIIDRLTRGTVLSVTGNQNEWLKVISPDNKNGWVHGDYVVTVEVGIDVLKGKTIVVDPGHGGSDPGAVGTTGIQEKVINLAVAKHLVELLQQAGATVLVTRTGDQSVSNQQRVDLANNAKANAYVSIHANAFSNSESNGTETHYCGENSSSSASKYLAQQLQRELVPALGLHDRGV